MMQRQARKFGEQKKVIRSFRISPADDRLLAEIARHRGVTKAFVIGDMISRALHNYRRRPSR